MRSKLFLFFSVLLILCSCSNNKNNKIIYPSDIFVKEYFDKPENKNLIDISLLDYEKNKNEYPQTAVILENSEYLIGIRKYVRMDKDWSSADYTPCVYGKSGKKYYKDIIEDLILNNNLFDISIFHNRYTYYDPFNEDYKNICWIKEKTESYVVFTMIFYQTPSVLGMLWLCPVLFSEKFYNEIKNKAEENNINNIIDVKKIQKRSYGVL